MKWFRLWTEILDDPKLSQLSAEDERRFIRLLAIAAEQEKDGKLTGGVRDFAWRMRTPEKALNKTIQKLISLNILKSNGNGLEFINWNKRQFRSDNPTERWKRWKANVGTNVGKTYPPTGPEAEADTDTDTDSLKSSRKPLIPTKEDLTESSIPKIKEDLDKLTKDLYDQKIFPRAPQFKNQMLKEGKNPRAILHCFVRCFIKKPAPTSAWAYCLKIIEVEDGNYNERDSTKAV